MHETNERTTSSTQYLPAPARHTRHHAVPASASLVALAADGDGGSDCRPDPPHSAELSVGRIRSGHDRARPHALSGPGAAMAAVREGPGVGRDRGAAGGRSIAALPVGHATIGCSDTWMACSPSVTAA